uniref:Sorbin and SH3 domain-containing protein 2 n=1 Tax=Heterorhabditis bacteriophora TaxID=37862 RepID=A0A1I7WMN5_HETBA
MRPGTSQWTVRAESQNEGPAEGNVEVPGYRSVAALRQEITSKLEMKSPSSPTPSKLASSLNNQKDGRNTPSWNSDFVQVYERNGLDDQKPYLGRVLDGPVPPHKFFQGVPPPSYNLCHSPVSSACSEPQSKPPLPPSIPPKPVSKTTRTIRLPQSTSILCTEENVTNDNLPQSEKSTPPANTQIYTILNTPKQFDSVSNEVNTKHEDTINGNVFDDGASLTSSCISNFGDTSVTTKKETSSRDSSNEEQKRSLFERSPSIHSMDLESSELLVKSRSPAPFSPYASSSSNHYGTIRRGYNPVTPKFNLNDMNSSSETISTPANVSYSFSNCTNDSGYEGGSVLSPDGPTPFTDIGDNVSSVAAPSTTDSRFEAFDADPHPECHESTMSSSTLDFENSAPSVPCAQSDGSVHRRQFSSISEPEISLWYRNMFKKMHKVDPETGDYLL